MARLKREKIGKKMKDDLRKIGSSSNHPNSNKTQVVKVKVYRQSLTQTVLLSKINNKVKKMVMLRTQVERH